MSDLSFSLLSLSHYIYILSWFSQPAQLLLDPPPPISQRTQLIKTDKQVHLDPLETAGGCIISLDKKRSGDLRYRVILLG